METWHVENIKVRKVIKVFFAYRTGDLRKNSHRGKRIKDSMNLEKKKSSVL